VRTGWQESMRQPLDVEAIENWSSVSRPLSQRSDVSIASSRAHSVDESHGAAGRSVSPRSASSKAKEIQDEWGISDPTVIDAMMKRNRRLKLVNIFVFNSHII
jgi:hypothetical protein